MSRAQAQTPAHEAVAQEASDTVTAKASRVRPRPRSARPRRHHRYHHRYHHAPSPPLPPAPAPPPPPFVASPVHPARPPLQRTLSLRRRETQEAEAHAAADGRRRAPRAESTEAPPYERAWARRLLPRESILPGLELEARERLAAAGPTAPLFADLGSRRSKDASPSPLPPLTRHATPP